MDEASRGLSKGSLKRFLGVLCHPGASPAPLAEPALAEGGSCASSPGTREQTPLFSAALGAAEPPAGGAGAGSEQRSRCPRRNCWVPAGRHRFSFPWERVFGSEGCGECRHLCRALCRAAPRAGPGELCPWGRSQGIFWPFPEGCSTAGACQALAPLGTKAVPRGGRDGNPPPHGGSAGDAARHRRSVPR